MLYFNEDFGYIPWDWFPTEEQADKFEHLLKEFLSWAYLEYNAKTIFPPKNNIFRAWEMTPFDSAKVVIVGQDCYHEQGQANGLAFAVNEGVKIPPSLRNILKEVDSEYGSHKTLPDLLQWATQGVMLLNRYLCVEEGKTLTAKHSGSTEVVEFTIRELSNDARPKVFILWGKEAQNLIPLIGEQHLILASAHPSPLSARRGFFGNGHFRTTNEFLQKIGQKEIIW